MPQFLATLTAAGTPQAVSSVCKNFRTATFIACKSINGPSAGANTGMVRMGLSASASEQPLEFNPGDERVIHAAAGQMLDLSQYYFDGANTGDGLVVLFQ